MMMAPPQVVGVLLKKPGQRSNPRVPPLDPQETKIRGELYVEDLNERRIVSIRMGWLWVENTQMRLPLRALNLRQASSGICQPHVLALGFTLSNSQGDLLATFWADTEPIYWSWVRAIAAELVRQTPFRAQRCLNFLEILTICPRGPLPLPDSPTETRRRSRSEMRCWLGNASSLSINDTRVHHDTAAILESSRRRARSELRGWSSSNSSDEDLHLVEFRGLQASILPKIEVTLDRRIWGCSESSEGSDDSLPWGGAACRSSVDSIDSAPSIMPEPVDTREQRIQRYKEARRRENEARSRRVLEEDAKKRKARREENNNNSHDNNETTSITEINAPERCIDTYKNTNDTTKNSHDEVDTSRNNKNNPAGTRNEETPTKTSIWTCQRTKKTTTNPETNGGVLGDPSIDGKTTKSTKTTTTTTRDPFVRAAETVDAIRNDETPTETSIWTCQRTKKTMTNAETNGGVLGDPSIDGKTTKSTKTRTTTTRDPFVRAAETVDAIRNDETPTETSIWTCQRTKKTTTNPETNGGVLGDPSIDGKTTKSTKTTTTTTKDPFVRAAETVDAIRNDETPTETSIWTCQRTKKMTTNPETNGGVLGDPSINGKTTKSTKTTTTTTTRDPFVRAAGTVDAIRNDETPTETSIWTCQRTKKTTTNPETNGGVLGDPSINGKTTKSTKTTTKTTTTKDPFVRAAETVDAIHRRLPPLKVSTETTQAIVRFKDNKGHDRDDTRNNNNFDKSTNNNKKIANNNNREISTRYKMDSPPSPGVVRTESGERRSRARERRNVRDKCQISLLQQTTNNTLKTTFLQERRERLSLASRIPISSDELSRTSSNSRLMDKMASVAEKMAAPFYVERGCRERAAVSLPRTATTIETTTTTAAPLSVNDVNTPETCEEDVARLLARCQRVDHYVPVREKLTLFESLSRLGGRLARSTEDLGRCSIKPNPRGKQRARSLHDLNRAARSVPVREMCRFFEGEKNNEELSISNVNSTLARLNETSSPSFGKICLKDPPVSILKNNNHYSDPPPCVRTSSRRKHYQK